MQASNQACITQAEKQLTARGLDPRVATLVFQDLFNLHGIAFTLSLSEKITEERQQQYDAAIDRVLTGEPFQYVVGFAHFYGETFQVTEDVLIPRFETEELVELLLNREPKEGLTIVDIGTGSGAIGLSLAKQSSNTVYVTDKFASTLEVAKANGKALGIDNVTFLAGDIFEPLIERDIKVDVLVSNPPYIGLEERDVMSESTRYEPESALFASNDGLYFYQRMIDHLHEVLNPGGRVYFEIGYRQGKAIQEYVSTRLPKVKVEIIKDINQHDRIIHFKWEVS